MGTRGRKIDAYLDSMETLVFFSQANRRISEERLDGQRETSIQSVVVAVVGIVVVIVPMIDGDVERALACVMGS